MSVSRLKALRVSAEAVVLDAMTMSFTIVFVNLKMVGSIILTLEQDVQFRQNSINRAMREPIALPCTRLDGILTARIDCKHNRDVLGQRVWRQGIEEQVVGVSREQAAENRRAIVAAATLLFRERGVEAVGLSELMKHAGFTQGGFYNHFKSKADLVAEVLASAIAEGNTEFTKFVRAPVDESTTALRSYVDWYLSQAHRDNIDHGCPVAGFAGDAPRLGAAAQSHFAGGLDDQITILAGLIAESGSLAAQGERGTLREQAINLHCEMLGALILSRSVAQAAPAFSNEILENARRDVLTSLDERASQRSKPRKKP